jgi:hypothetical protein
MREKLGTWGLLLLLILVVSTWHPSVEAKDNISTLKVLTPLDVNQLNMTKETLSSIEPT